MAAVVVDDKDSDIVSFPTFAADDVDVAAVLAAGMITSAFDAAVVVALRTSLPLADCTSFTLPLLCIVFNWPTIRLVLLPAEAAPTAAAAIVDGFDAGIMISWWVIWILRLAADVFVWLVLLTLLLVMMLVDLPPIICVVDSGVNLCAMFIRLMVLLCCGCWDEIGDGTAEASNAAMLLAIEVTADIGLGVSDRGLLAIDWICNVVSSG